MKHPSLARPTRTTSPRAPGCATRRPTGPTGPAGAAVAAALLATACGDPLASDGYRGDALYHVQGNVSPRVGAAPEGTSLEVGVLWLNRSDDGQRLRVQATRGAAIGAALPATFDVSLVVPPDDALLGTSWDFTATPPVDPARVGFGVVVVDSEGILAGLDAELDVLDVDAGGLATLLSQLRYASPFGVHYAKDAEADGLTRTLDDGTVVAVPDYSTFDFTGYVTSWCYDRVQRGPSPLYQACLDDHQAALADADAARAACVAACPPVNTPEDLACRDQCWAAHDGRREIETACAALECGPPAPPIRVKDVAGPLELELGASDSRDALTSSALVQ